ncbi:MAG TPA: TMEM175 family protein [Chloroflexota bacterium]
MSTLYNRFAGDNLERLAALSDGVFAIAMTLLVLNLHVPASNLVHNEAHLWRALTDLTPNFVAYLMSFLTLGIFWVGQQTQLNRFARSDRDLAWIHLAFLFVISLMPFSTALLAGFITYRLALLAYWLNILLPGILLYAGQAYAWHAGLVKEDTTPAMRAAAKRRVIMAQSLYALGAALCIVSTYLSIGFIVLVQLDYAIAPRIRPLDRI